MVTFRARLNGSLPSYNDAMRCVRAVLFLATGCHYAPAAGTDAAPPPDVPTDMPIDQAIDLDGPVSIVIEAELPTTTTSADGVHAWLVETAMTGFTGSGYITAVPNDFNHCIIATDPSCGAYSTYAITIP